MQIHFSVPVLEKRLSESCQDQKSLAAERQHRGGGVNVRHGGSGRTEALCLIDLSALFLME